MTLFMNRDEEIMGFPKVPLERMTMRDYFLEAQCKWGFCI